MIRRPALPSPVTPAALLIALLTGCAAPSAPPPAAPASADAATPPDLTELNVDLDDPAETRAGGAVARAAPLTDDGTAGDSGDGAATRVDKALFPGLRQRADANADPDRLPFERGVAERRKRIDLGLESADQEEKPVNNILDMSF